MKKNILAAALLTGLSVTLAAPAVEAQSIQIGPGGITIQPDRDRDRGRPGPERRGPDRRGIDARDAQRIARSNGMREVHDVDQRRGNWVVRGRDRRGSRIVMTISSRSGQVIDVDRRGWR